jgi:aspartate beta-hydroxylase
MYVSDVAFGNIMHHSRKLQDNWQQIREEALVVLANKVFQDEAENLRDVGNWQQFELYARGELRTKMDVGA